MSPAPPIGGSNGMQAVGSALAARAPAGGQTPPASNGANAAAPAAGQDAQRQQMMAGMQRISQLAEQTKQIATEFPMTAEVMMQIQQMLKQAVIAMAPMAPQQTGSGQAVPGGGQSM